MPRRKREIAHHGLRALAPEQAVWIKRRIERDRTCYFLLRQKFPGCGRDQVTRDFLRLCERIYAELIHLDWLVQHHAGDGHPAEIEQDQSLWNGDGI